MQILYYLSFSYNLVEKFAKINLMGNDFEFKREPIQLEMRTISMWEEIRSLKIKPGNKCGR